MTTLDQRTPLGLVKGAYTTKTELRLPDEVSYEDWLEIGKQLAILSSASAWWVGDWFHYGQWEYGERKIQAENLGIDYDTARDYAYVAGRFKLSIRIDTLTFSHHRLVASLDPEAQDHWLGLANTQRWSVAILRERMRDAQALKALRPPAVAAVVFKITAAAEQHECWTRAAAHVGLDLNDWATLTLDEAATQLLAA
jgi:hypothetical protein